MPLNIDSDVIETDKIKAYEDSTGTVVLEDKVNNTQVKLNDDVTMADVASHLVADTNPHATTLEQARAEDNQLSGAVDAGGNDVTNVGALGTDRLYGAADLLVSDNDDVYQLETLDPGSVVALDPAGQWDLTETLSIPQGTTVLHGASAAGPPTFLRDFSGSPAIERAAGSTLIGIDLTDPRADGDKSADDDGIVNDQAGGRRRTLIKCAIRNQGGNGIVESGGAHYREEDVYIVGCGGWAKVQTSIDNGDNPRRANYHSEYRNCDAGGVFVEQPASGNGCRANEYNIRQLGHGGPAYKIVSKRLVASTFRNQISSCDGPTILVTDTATEPAGGFRACEFKLSTGSTLSNPDSGLTDPVGQIHMEAARSSSGTITSGQYGSSDYASGALISNQSSNSLRLDIVGGFASASEAVTGRIIGACWSGLNWSGADFTRAVGGGGNAYLVVDPTLGKMRWEPAGQVAYWRPQSSAPSPSAEHIYFDDGTNTGSGNAAWRYDSDGDGTYEAETN